MADIAILVAEEYERRMSMSRHTAVSTSAAPAEFDWRKIVSAKMTVAIDKLNFQSLKNISEPKSEFAIAVSHGVFSP
ncbi:hypothetical protein CARUB_v10028622mg [Capsella rubella]|uniref:Uncharacterized protein n=1 Tax=Capsella rubella TaxID=81985 RepID=R0GVM5_9BRAS|nr:uncharacterized protein LOC17876311 [Capsella rubella]EOA15228.1 hypothetical protein CARUB_v10028622mg [Capsella rubella]